ncbi:hypothetical protein FA95DRAFT_1587186 [Auriscalpium vulgare]|uniref:Uncharacterized protein n=1 Tax=Auriscalpium vulgare TaxID=40419 RepID=A0ACB8S5P1_9AGAM|nr:hypothetical protein FA95DRAFT_1587186 [Auriscalpium vulgare]
MDDALEQPQFVEKDAAREKGEDESSGDEDEGPDWTKIPNPNRPVIPKRGEKDFEPAPGGGSGLQTHHLNRARAAMFDALRTTRAISSKSVSYAIWYPALARAHVTVARGVHFTSMGHSIARPSKENQSKALKRLELLPEETLYLMEKGALFCWQWMETFVEDDLNSTTRGAPMSVQQAFAEMMGKEDINLEKYHVYAYLRRLGYIVTRAKPPSAGHPAPSAHSHAPAPTVHSGYLRSFFNALFSPFTRLLRRFFAPAFDWWRPLAHRRWLHHSMDYASVFTSLRFIPAGHSRPLMPAEAKLPTTPPSPYEVFYHVYKPNTPFRKTAPPAPDFHIVVVDARKTPFPTIHELSDLYAELPTLPRPLPRRRNLQPVTASTRDPPKAVVTTQKQPPAPWQSLFARLFSLSFLGHATPPQSADAPPERKVNPFMALRQGHKTAVIAAVDASVVSFFRLGEGSFEEWPMA